MNAVVALLEPPYMDLTYTLPPGFPEDFWKPGLRCAVPVGTGPLRPAIVRRLTDEVPVNAKGRPFVLKAICWPLENRPLLSGAVFAMLEDLASRQCAPCGQTVALLVPFLKDLKVSLHRPGASAGESQGSARTVPLSRIRQASPEERLAWARELAEGSARMLPPRKDPALNERCVLAVDPPWPVRPSARLQIKCLEHLAFHGPCNRRQLAREIGAAGSAVIAKLLAQGAIAIERDEEDEPGFAVNEALLAPEALGFELNADQRHAVADVADLLERGEAAHRLLYGVTGSGKTAVYLELARRCLALGRSVLLLAPEVALAHKLRRDAAQALPGTEPVLYHGYQYPTRREAIFRSLAASRGPCLAVGTRSALFLPLPRLGLVVLDEEHDASFKQDEGLPYQAKELAWFRAGREKAVLVLGSATPDLKTWHAVQNQALPVLELPRRVTGRELPPIELVDISRLRQLGQEDASGLAPRSIEALEDAVERGEQAMVLLNRRGFAHHVYCQGCRETLACPNCAVGLSYHRGEGRLLCHYCGWSMPFPAPCPKCSGMDYLPVGDGTEKLADWLSARLSQPVLRLDRDSTRRPGAVEDLLARFARGEAPVMVGTQMLSKGHHFPDVTLAVVADGDLGLSIPDYRAAESTFQLLVQSAGRAGRGDKPGRVLIQTRDVGHYCWQYVAKSDYEGFYREEIARRQRYGYPPFVRLAMIRFSYERESQAGEEAMQEACAFLKREARTLQVRLLGPVPSPIPWLSGRKRWHCLIKAQDWQIARRLYCAVLARPEAAKLRIQLDLDPMSML
ncbi:MAG: primosomal protein N' [Desulfovibrio sp.]|nr:primosomal protein N' [Desulfovibrio sp.]